MTDDDHKLREHLCDVCKCKFQTGKELFDHSTENGPVKCKKGYENKMLGKIGIPPAVPRIDLSGVLSMLKNFI